MILETLEILTGEMNNGILRELDKLMNRVNTLIQTAIEEAISRQVMSQKSPLWET